MSDDDPVDRLAQSLQELDETGSLDSERITFKPTRIGGVHLDDIGTILDDVDYGRHPVRIVIEPATDVPEDHHYQIRFEDLSAENEKV